MANENVNETNNETTNAPAPTRYTLMVENTFAIEENKSIACTGNLHGKIKKGDTFLFIHPKFPMGLEATVDALVVDNETKDEAENCRVAVMTSSVNDPAEIPKYTVISNVRPQPKPQPNVPVENPYLVGLTTEYSRLISDSEFAFSFMAALLTSMLITPAEVAQPKVSEETGKTEQKISFKLLPHPDNKELHVLPLFTDVAAMHMWEGLFKDGKPIMPTIALPFEKSSEVALANGGIVINPFGPVAVYVSNTNVQNTLNLKQQITKKQQEQKKAENK